MCNSIREKMRGRKRPSCRALYLYLCQRDACAARVCLEQYCLLLLQVLLHWSFPMRDQLATLCMRVSCCEILTKGFGSMPNPGNKSPHMTNAYTCSGVTLIYYKAPHSAYSITKITHLYHGAEYIGHQSEKAQWCLHQSVS